MAAFDGHKNFAYTTVATAPSPATSGTSLVVATGTGANLPAAPFNAVVWPTGIQPTAANSEILRVSNVATDTLTFTRQAESSNNRAITVGDQLMVAVTAKTLADLEAGYNASISFTADQSVKRITVTDANVVTTSKIHLGAPRRADITDVVDPGWVYITNIVTIANGSFDVLIVALDLDGPTLSAPNETVTLFYKIWS